MEMGKKIRQLRTERGVTQERMAQALNVTAQAVSKWENGTALPDVAMLPALSVFFGVRIDELFEMSGDTHYERIGSMLETEHFLSREDFEYAERFLKGRGGIPAESGRSQRLLAELYNHRAEGYRRLAGDCARRALEREPAEKDAHSALCKAEGGAVWDWCCANHHELIAYYQDFTRRHPGYRPGYLWLLDNLLADLRLEEAETALAALTALGESYHVPLYRGYIHLRRGEFTQAVDCWREMCRRYPGEWMAWASMGDGLAKLCRYEEAVSCFEEAIRRQAPPRYIDNHVSIAHIREIQGRYEEAAEAYRAVTEILAADWGMSEGDTVEQYRGAAIRLLAQSRRGG